MSNWRDILAALEQGADAAVLVTVGPASGSVPRDSGAAMLVTGNAIAGSIGGGRLEQLATEAARDMLTGEDVRKDRILDLPLGPELAQCCGGRVDILISKLSESDFGQFRQLNNIDKDTLLITEWQETQSQRRILNGASLPDHVSPAVRQAAERCRERPGTEIVFASDTAFTLVQSLREEEFDVVLFGAGHVGRKVVEALSPLPCHLTWIDEREAEFPSDIPANVARIVSSNPMGQVPLLPAGAFHLVMTHSHQRDLEICEALLRRNDAAYIGLIGSATKKAKFRKRLALRGYSDQQTARIICPIGLVGLSGKRPAEIAASVAADILMRHQQRRMLETTGTTETALG